MKKPIEIINNDYSDYLHLEYSLTNTRVSKIKFYDR